MAWVLPLVFLLMVQSCLSTEEPPQTIYEALQMNGLPRGLLPDGITNFTFDRMGNFEVFLEKPCFARLENQVYYEATVKGNLSFGRIGGLSGMNTKELFLWLPVKNICVDVPDRGLIYFDVGVVEKEFSLSIFENPPKCKDTRAPSRVESTERRATVDAKEKALSGNLQWKHDNDVWRADQ